jgi:predicted 2-oxoglutarate/Fe(II)-dependent dioxygenase YbiX
LLHEVTPVTRGARYATLPFLYDEAAVKDAETKSE